MQYILFFVSLLLHLYETRDAVGKSGLEMFHCEPFYWPLSVEPIFGNPSISHALTYGSLPKTTLEDEKTTWEDEMRKKGTLAARKDDTLTKRYGKLEFLR